MHFFSSHTKPPPPKKCICKNANDCKRDNFLLSMRYSYNSKKFIQFSFSGNVIMSRSQNRNSREGFTTFSLQKVITTQFAKKSCIFLTPTLKARGVVLQATKTLLFTRKNVHFIKNTISLLFCRTAISKNLSIYKTLMQ